MFESINQKHYEVQFRYLKHDDSQKGLFKLLSQLTKAPSVPKQMFQQHLNRMQLSNSLHVNIVGEDKQTHELVAFGSIIICQTVYGRVGKIQNIVTCESVRGKGYGKVIIQLLKDQGWKQQCQKITLFCEDKNVKFYEKLGFKLQGDMYAFYK